MDSVADQLPLGIKRQRLVTEKHRRPGRRNYYDLETMAAAEKISVDGAIVAVSVRSGGH